MVWDASHWKGELARIALRLHARLAQRRWTERSGYLIEKDVFVAAYAVRKLIEAHKLSDDIVGRRVPVVSHPARQGRTVTLLNWHKVQDLYDISTSHQATVTLTELCNQFVHSYVFVPLFGDSGMLEKIAVSSDRDRKRRLLSLTVADYVALLVAIVNDDVVHIHHEWDEELGDFKVTSHAENLADNEYPWDVE